MFQYPINWRNTLFLSSTLLVTVAAVPAYIWFYGLNLFQLALFLFFFCATGLSITLGYHRLFSHLTFQASWPVRFGALVFGAAAFENSALAWVADHRRHHKFVDSDEDPYDISKGFFHAHVGWILFRCPPTTSLDWAKDLQSDRLVMWQHRNYVAIAIATAFALPAAIGWLYDGWIGALGAFLIAGVARVVCVHHMTFFINSLCHTIGRQTYSSRCSAKDSAIMAWLTFGEGYHNFHHEFQHDYRNGVKPWHFDPTKWCIWLLYKFALVGQIRRVSEDKILLAQAAEQHRQITARLSAHPTHAQESLHRLIQAAQTRLQQTSNEWARLRAEYRKLIEVRMEPSRDRVKQLRRELREEGARLRAAWRNWQNVLRLVSES